MRPSLQEVLEEKIAIAQFIIDQKKMNMTTQSQLEGELTIDEGAATPAWLAILPEDGSTGGYFGEDRQPMSW